MIRVPSPEGDNMVGSRSQKTFGSVLCCKCIVLKSSSNSSALVGKLNPDIVIKTFPAEVVATNCGPEELADAGTATAVAVDGWSGSITATETSRRFATTS